MRHDLVLHDVELDGRRRDVGITGDRIDTVAARIPSGDQVVDAGGGALLPGLWDHHLHLLSMAAAATSVDLADVDGRGAVRATLRAADRQRSPGTWIRAVGHHESTGGPLDREVLDEMVSDRPVRVQHRSGAMWVLNTAACHRVGLDDPTGQVVGDDAWLRSRLPPDDAPDLAPVGRALAATGVTGVTDMTPTDDPTSWDLLADACARGALPQRVVVTGGPELTRTAPPAPLTAGPVKLYLADHGLPGLDDLASQVADAHLAGRAVAFHSVTRSSLVLALAALEVAGVAPGDRVEHGAVVPPDLADLLAAGGVTVVTQPSFLADRGDRYLGEVDEEDVPHLYPCRRLLERGIAVGGSTDAPFGPADPWQAIAAATRRRSGSGRTVGADRPVGADTALALFLGAPERPGGPARTVGAGAPADLCVLGQPLADVLASPADAHVRATVVAGTVVHLA